jgi:hypothetical protein
LQCFKWYHRVVNRNSATLLPPHTRHNILLLRDINLGIARGAGKDLLRLGHLVGVRVSVALGGSNLLLEPADGLGGAVLERAKDGLGLLDRFLLLVVPRIS